MKYVKPRALNLSEYTLAMGTCASGVEADYNVGCYSGNSANDCRTGGSHGGADCAVGDKATFCHQGTAAF